MNTPKHTPEDWRAFNEAERLECIRDAAPELLEALIDVLNRFEEAFPGTADFPPLARGRAAIAKATGNAAIEAKEKP